MKHVDSLYRYLPGHMLLVPCLSIGAAAGCFALPWLGPAVGLSLAALGAVAGLSWRAGEPPTLAFCLGVQWLAPAVGLIYQRLTGVFPGMPEVASADGAVIHSMAGLVVLAAGVQAVEGLQPQVRERTSHGSYDTRRLFWAVVGAHLVFWFVEVNPRLVSWTGAEVISNLLLLRSVLLALLFVIVARQRQGYLLAAIAFGVALVPRLASTMSTFKDLFFFALLAALGQWSPPRRGRPSAARLELALGGVTLAAALVVMGLLWEGAVKPAWRQAVRSGAADGSPLDRAAAFALVTRQAVLGFDLGEASEALATRLTSGAGYFALVLEYVPAYMPHEHGAMSQRAVGHVIKPRLLFPDKPDLGGDSWLVRTYTGRRASEEGGTSVGLGYMAQLYIDYGSAGMVAGLFVYGAYLGLLLRLLRRASPDPDLFASAAMVALIQHLLSYDGELAKQVGGLTQTILVFSAILLVAGRRTAYVLSGAPHADGGRTTARRVSPPARMARSR